MSPPPLTLQLFGPLRVLMDGDPLPRLRTRSVEWLLALLVLRHGRVVERSWLAGTLWPESEESKALNNLRNDLVHLRKALGREGVRVQSPSRDTLTLNLEGAEVDIVEFDAAMKAGNEDSLQSAVAFYTGPLLEGCYEAWVSQERESREQACLTALETLADRAAERGEHAEAIRHLRQAEALDPLRDTTIRRLMTSLQTTGDAAAAIEVYRNFRNQLHETLSLAPDAETTRLFQDIRARARETNLPPTRPSVPSPPRSVSPDRPLARPPHPLAPLIGREQEVEDIRERLQQNRLVTLMGAGGVGKTRLAMEVSRRAEEDFEGGVVWVELAPLADGALVLPTLASALGIRQEGRSDLETLLSQVVSSLSDGAFLLALDNCEHLLDSVADIVQHLLSRCPDLRVLATSRQRLGLGGEVAWRVPSLSAPDPEHLPADLAEASATALSFPAVRLFVERASSAYSGFQLRRRAEVEAVCQVCRRLDGIPLALELAAARTNVLSVEQIASRLDDRFRLLSGGSRVESPRHRTLRALIDWSHDQLSEPERLLLRRLSVFAGGWSLEATEYISKDEGGRMKDESHFIADPVHNLHPSSFILHPSDDVMEVLFSLVDKSLVLVEEQTGGLRYRMLETIREYATERLRESGEEEAVRERHADYCLMLAEQAKPFLMKPEPDWLVWLERELDNLRGALTCFAAHEETVDKAVRMTASLEVFWSLRGHRHERRTWLMNLSLRHTPPTAARAQMLTVAGWLLNNIDGNSTLAKQFFAESLRIMQQLGDQKGIAEALNGLAVLESDADKALALAEQSVAVMREVEDRQGLADSLYHRGCIARQVGDYDLARECWMEANTLNEAMGQKGGLVLRRLGDLAVASGDYAEARRLFGRFVTERFEIGDRWSVAWGLRGFSELALAEGQPERAAAILGASVALKVSLADPLSEAERAPYEPLLNALQAAIGEAAFADAWEAGRGMTCEEAIQFALEEATA